MTPSKPVRKTRPQMVDAQRRIAALRRQPAPPLRLPGESPCAMRPHAGLSEGFVQAGWA